MNCIRSLTVWIAMAVAVSLPAWAAKSTSHPVDAAVAQGVATNKSAAKSQEKVETLDDQRADMFDEYRRLLRQSESIEGYNRHLEELVSAQVDELEALDGHQAEIEQTQREILPLMQRMMDTLEQFVGLDLPFLEDERRQRLERLRTMMGDPGIGVAEKFRRLLEAYQIESEYGHTIEAYRGPLPGAGAEDPMVVDFLRFGRVGLYYLAPDRRSGGAWDRSSGTWRPLDEQQNRRLLTALRVARKTMAPALLELPMRIGQPNS